MRTIKINVPAEVVNYVQRVGFECEARADIIKWMFDRHKLDEDASVISSPAFKAYHDEYVEFRTEFEMAKVKIQEEYVPKVLNGHKINWNLDYNTEVLQIDILCDCEIDGLEEYLND